MKTTSLLLLRGALALAVLAALPAAAHKRLKARIEAIAAQADAQVGVAVIVDGRETLTVNNSADYPLMSVFKFHQALAVADFMRRTGLAPDDSVYVSREDMRPDTWSPLRDLYPGGDCRITLRRLLEYSLQQSDNNACDILFGLTGGPRRTAGYLRGLGLRRFDIVATEDDMHRRPELCYANRTSPLEAARLLELFETGAAGNDPIAGLIRELMTGCLTGADRLMLPLAGTGAVAGHKTGTSDLNAEGRWPGTNDIGFVRLPSGRRYVLAVFVKDSAEAPVVNARIIADISRAVLRYVQGLDPLEEP